MANLPESGVKLVIETDSAQSAIDEISSSLDALQGQSYTASVEVEVDDAATADIPVDDTEVTTTVDVETTTTSEEALSALNFLKNAEIIKTTWSIAVKGLELFTDVGGKLINPILDLGDAVAEVGAKTGGAIPNADKLINGIFFDDLGQSREEVGKLIVKAHELGLPIEEATRAALTFTHTWSDTDSVTAITTFGTLLNTHLVDNMKEASDLMAVFFQEGGNKGGDALTVVNSNAESWSNMGLTAQQALSTISSLLKGNVEDATTAAKMIQTLDDNLTTAAADASSPQAQLLKQMGLKNPKDTGEAMGADFIDGFAAAFAKMPANQQDLISGTFMGKGGKKFTGAIEEMTANSDMFKNVTDAAEIAAKEVDDSFRGAIDDFVLEANKKINEFLSSTAIDIPGKINKLKEGLQQGMNKLAEGGTLSEALTVALKPIGFDDEFQGLESALGNFIVALLQVVASIQDVTGHGAEAEGTRIVIAKMATTQLDFDLKIANPDEVATDIATATSRGLSSDQISGTVSKVISDLINTGTKDSLAQAQLLVDTLKKPIDQNKLPTLASGAPMNVEPVVSDEAISTMQTKINKAMEVAPPPDVVDSLAESMGLVTTSTKGVHDKMMQAVNPLDKVTDNTRNLTYAATKVEPKLGAQANATYTVEASAQSATVALVGFNVSLQETLNTAASVSNAAAQQAQNNNNNTDSNIPNSNPDAPSGPSIMAAILSAITGGGSVYNGGAVHNNIVNNNNVQSIAQADRLGFRQSAILRGQQGM